MLAAGEGDRSSLASALGFDRRSLRKDEELISMDFFDAAYAMFVNDPDVQECISSIMHDCSQFGFVLSVDGEETELDRRANIHIRDHFLDTAVRASLFIYMISGFVFFARSKDRDGNAVPMVPPWGTGVITRQIRGPDVKYRYYTTRKVEGLKTRTELVPNKNYFLKRYMVNVNGKTVEHDSILTSLIPLKFRSMFLLDSDAKTGRLLSRQIVVMEHVPEKETKMLESEEKELANRWHMQRRGDWEGKRGPEDNSLRAELRKHLDRLHVEYAIRETQIELELSTYSRYRSGRKGRSSPQDVSREISEGPVGFLMDRVTVDKGKKLVNPTLPSYRSDLLEHLKQIRTQFLDRLGYIPPSISINRPNRASIETRVIEKERRRALLPWSEVISRILTDMYVWTYHDFKHNASAAERMFRGDPELPALLRRLKEEDGREYALNLRFKDVVPLSVTEDFFQRGFIGAERFVHDVLEHSGISKPHIESYLRDNAKHIRSSEKARLLSGPLAQGGAGGGGTDPTLSRHRRLSEASDSDRTVRYRDESDDTELKGNNPSHKNASKPNARANGGGGKKAAPTDKKRSRDPGGDDDDDDDEKEASPKKKKTKTSTKPENGDSDSDSDSEPRKKKKKARAGGKAGAQSKEVVPSEEGAKRSKSKEDGKEEDDDDDKTPSEKKKRKNAETETKKPKEGTEKKKKKTKEKEEEEETESESESDPDEPTARAKKSGKAKKADKRKKKKESKDESDSDDLDARTKKPQGKGGKKRKPADDKSRTKSSATYRRQEEAEDDDLFLLSRGATTVDSPGLVSP